MRVVRGRTIAELSSEELAARRDASAGVLVDLGCGDGAYLHRLAGAWPDWLFVGVDPDREALAAASRRAARRPERGGRANVLYVWGRLEELPPELDGCADAITVIYPWAGLLEHFVQGSAVAATALRRLVRNGAAFELVWNADAETRGLRTDDPDAVGAALTPALEAAGFRVNACGWLPAEAAPPSRWGGRLVRGSGRRTLHLIALRGGSAIPAPLVRRPITE